METKPRERERLCAAELNNFKLPGFAYNYKIAPQSITRLHCDRDNADSIRLTIFLTHFQSVLCVKNWSPKAPSNRVKWENCSTDDKHFVHRGSTKTGPSRVPNRYAAHRRKYLFSPCCLLNNVLSRTNLNKVFILIKFLVLVLRITAMSMIIMLDLVDWTF